jgi:nitroreductase
VTSDAHPERVPWDQVPVPHTNITVYEALHRRRMAWKFQDRPVPIDALERMLATAVWAPNHRLTEPWRFLIMAKDSPLRKMTADLVYQGLRAEWQSERRAEPYRTKVLAPPIVMYAFYVDGSDQYVTRENYASTVCALHNIGLAGYAEGLSVTWDTGRVTRVPGLDAALGSEQGWNVLAMLSIGYPDDSSASSRTPASNFVRWG